MNMVGGINAGMALGPMQSLSEGGYLNNLFGTTDPGVLSDASQGYGPGSTWLNLSTSRQWVCLSNSTGAATWILAGVVPGVGIEPSSMLTQFGAGTGSFFEEGNINRQVSGAGVSPTAAAATDYVLFTYTLPANSFDIAGRGLCMTSEGSFGATGNNKIIKLWFGCTAAVVGAAVSGGTAIGSTGTVTTNAGGWSIQANVFKYGAAGSNTQLSLHQQAQVGNATSALLAPQLLTVVENASIIMCVTGQAPTATTDIVANFFEINVMN
jgi:hypothetical protein